MNKKEQGFIVKYIFWIVVVVLILSYLGFNLKKFMESDLVIENLNYLKSLVIKGWYLLQPVYEWIINLFGPSIYNTITNLQSGDMGISNSLLKIPLLPKGEI